MKQTTSQIQKKVIIIIVLALISIITKAQSQMSADYNAIALAETEENDNTVELETSVVNISSVSASEKVLEITKLHIMENNNRKPIHGATATKTVEMSATTNSSAFQEMADADFLIILKRAIEETKKAKIENTYLRLIKK